MDGAFNITTWHQAGWKYAQGQPAVGADMSRDAIDLMYEGWHRRSQKPPPSYCQNSVRSRFIFCRWEPACNPCPQGQYSNNASSGQIREDRSLVGDSSPKVPSWVLERAAVTQESPLSLLLSLEPQ